MQWRPRDTQDFDRTNKGDNQEMNTTMTPAESAVWTPPPGTTPGTILVPWGKPGLPDAIADTPENRFQIAWCASQPWAKQGLYADWAGAYQGKQDALTLADRQALCRTLFAEGYDIFIAEYWGQTPYGELRNFGQIGMATVPAFDPVELTSAQNGHTFSTSLSPTSYEPAPWAVALLTPAAPVTVTNPIGPFEGFGVDGQPGAKYGNVAGSPFGVAQIGEQWPANPQSGDKVYMLIPSGAGPIGPTGVEWMLLRTS